ncbi:MAG: ATP synthase F1 subunit epsilon [Candidatus Moranbacteria bacterium]|nr:ATP synthase F1 subunit epsilon [Candidatus Moranbacteria bacterium]
MRSIKLKIVTPERLVLEEEAYSVTLPSEGGEVTILPDHIPYIGALRAGEIHFRRTKDSESEALATSGGFVEFHGNVLSVLADTAERAEEIDIERAEAAKKRAEELKAERSLMDDEEYARVAASLEKEFARLRVARKHRSKGGFIAPGE